MSEEIVSGRIWLDEFPGWSLYRDTGTIWEKWGHFNELTEPDQTLFSWINQGTATISTVYGPTILTSPGSAGDDVHLRVQSTPATPYNLISAFTPQIDPADNTSCGMVLRDSATGEFIFFRLLFDTTSVITKSDIVFSLDKYDNPTTFNSNYSVVSAGFMRGSIIWLQIIDDGINLSWNYSNDGQNYINLTTQSRTNFLVSGPNQIGFAINSNTIGDATGMTLLSWD